jgi:hypothetical protein
MVRILTGFAGDHSHFEKCEVFPTAMVIASGSKGNLRIAPASQSIAYGLPQTYTPFFVSNFLKKSTKRSFDQNKNEYTHKIRQMFPPNLPRRLHRRTSAAIPKNANTLKNMYYLP